jgi:hypothetical protein
MEPTRKKEDRTSEKRLENNNINEAMEKVSDEMT